MSGTPPTASTINLATPTKARRLLAIKETVGLKKATQSATTTSSLIKLQNYLTKLTTVSVSLTVYQAALVAIDHARIGAFTSIADVYGRNNIDIGTGSRPSSNPVQELFLNDGTALMTINKHYKHHDMSQFAAIPNTKPRSESDPPRPAPTLHPNTSPFMIDRFGEHLISYIDCYIATVKSLQTSFARLDGLRREYDHYKVKVDAMQGSKKPDAEKLARNHQKLAAAQGVYSAAADRLSAAVDITVDEGWKELHPFILRVIQFERNFAKIAESVAADLLPVEERVCAIGDEFKLTRGGGGGTVFGRLKGLFETVRGGGPAEKQEDEWGQTTPPTGPAEKKRWSMFGGKKKEEEKEELPAAPDDGEGGWAFGGAETGAGDGGDWTDEVFPGATQEPRIERTISDPRSPTAPMPNAAPPPLPPPAATAPPPLPPPAATAPSRRSFGGAEDAWHAFDSPAKVTPPLVSPARASAPSADWAAFGAAVPAAAPAPAPAVALASAPLPVYSNGGGGWASFAAAPPLTSSTPSMAAGGDPFDAFGDLPVKAAPNPFASVGGDQPADVDVGVVAASEEEGGNPFNF